MTFSEMIGYGNRNSSSTVLEMPWSFEINGYHITHETDTSYVIETLEGNHLMKFDDMLIIGIKGEVYPCKRDIFDLTYEKVEEK